MLIQNSYPDEYPNDFREDELFMTIETLRCELLEVAQQRSLSDSTVLALSERLDRYILMAQNKMMEGLRSRKSGTSLTV
ncbi:aspartyl-phosphate phosphatase Spo0E family protein [Paenibacillus wynnii]|uniref:aspartyl-phosphate phosphatase Spo0E family protein n=1 Tax=Paenibacillus wynnii TaxID=268407 RepID=UPI002793706D|nr:aspartyl-phosphate phosphatase Spo0E family protein [Paenibacillus wynnii]MDQ0192290.1 hypothetical protein [Paenibacillus wynnii]